MYFFYEEKDEEVSCRSVRLLVFFFSLITLVNNETVTNLVSRKLLLALVFKTFNPPKSYYEQKKKVNEI